LKTDGVIRGQIFVMCAAESSSTEFEDRMTFYLVLWDKMG